jgi:hypothetical protein
MSVPPRTTLRVARQRVSGRRYRIDIETTIRERFPGKNLNDFFARAREDVSAVLLELIDDRGEQDGEPVARLARICGTALEQLRLPAGFGYFVDEPTSPGITKVHPAAAIAILAARSGPLYLPGRFEPSLIGLRPVTLFFPFFAAVSGGHREEAR